MKKFLALVLCLTGLTTATAQQGYWGRVEKREPTLGIAEVYQRFDTPEFRLKLVRASQTVAALSPVKDPYFDFSPGDRLEIRDKDSLYHLGDINLRVRVGEGPWKDYSSAVERAAVEPLEPNGDILAAADLANTLAKDIPVTVKRFWELDHGQLVLRFEIANKIQSPVELGALGLPMIFNNILEGKSLTEAHAENVFFDPYIGMDAGYLEVKRLSGRGPALLVLPKENMAFEAYRPLLDDPTPKSIVFEGFHEWMAHSKAYAQKEWKGVEQWNPPSSVILGPGERRNYSLKFVLAGGIRDIQQKLVEEKHPRAIGVPGYVVPQDVIAQLLIDHQSPIMTMEVEPKGALEIEAAGRTPSGLAKYRVRGKKWGRARLTLGYGDGKVQTINYKVIKPEARVIDDFGHFLTTAQWFDAPGDPFGRNPSVITYDYEKKAQVVQDGRAWIAGLSDEGGAGSWLAAIMKQLVRPNREEITKLQQFMDRTLWGGLQYDRGPKKYGVKKSLFYYEPDSLPTGTYDATINFNTWAAWDQGHANSVERSYNYPHVAAAHWAFYRLARYHQGLVDSHKWDWYLGNAYHTAVAMVEQAPYYAQFGQMEGSVFLYILQDLKNEGLTEMADDLEKRMKARADHWKALDYPFGSEMPWDSTGQEEVYMWSDHFGHDRKALVTLSAILAYMPTMPHWAYNGNARRYWDFLYGGKAGETSRVERQIHHYGSSLNAIPVLNHFRKEPDNLYLLKVGYGGLLGGIANITQDGFGPAAFHSYPSSLKIDGISGDYGSGFYGYAVNTSSYLVHDQGLGWLAFGGNLEENGTLVTMEITTAAKSRVYIAPRKLWVTLDAGALERVSYDQGTGEVLLNLGPATSHTPKAYLRTSPPVELSHGTQGGAHVIELGKKQTQIKL